MWGMLLFLTALVCTRTIDYLKTLHTDYVEWDTDLGSLIWPEDTYYLIDNLSDDDFKELAELEASLLLASLEKLRSRFG